MRIFKWTWPFAFGVRLGWATTRVPNPDVQRARGRVYLLRGNGIVFSRGLGRICGRLRRRGIWAEDLCCVADRWVVRNLLADQRAGRLRGPVVFVGHSCGARSLLFAAAELRETGLSVDLVVCLDVALPQPVPENVRNAVNLYIGGRRLYPAQPLRPANPSVTGVHNIDLSAANCPIRAPWLSHLTITNSMSVQALILKHILAAFRPRGEERSSAA